jgi:hypothetical protein
MSDMAAMLQRMMSEDATPKELHVQLINGRASVTALGRLRKDNIALKLTSTVDVPGVLTKGKMYRCDEYSGHQSGSKMVLHGEIADDTGLVYKFTLNDHHTDLVLDIPFVEQTYAQLVRDELREKARTVTKLLDAYRKPAERALKVGDYVKWAPGLQSSGMSRKTLGIVTELNSERLAEITKEMVVKSFILEKFDCLVAALDNDDDLTFYPCNSSRLIRVDVNIDEGDTPS